MVAVMVKVKEREAGVYVTSKCHNGCGNDLESWNGVKMIEAAHGLGGVFVVGEERRLRWIERDRKLEHNAVLQVLHTARSPSKMRRRTNCFLYTWIALGLRWIGR